MGVEDRSVSGSVMSCVRVSRCYQEGLVEGFVKGVGR